MTAPMRRRWRHEGRHWSVTIYDTAGCSRWSWQWSRRWAPVGRGVLNARQRFGTGAQVAVAGRAASIVRFPEPPR